MTSNIQFLKLEYRFSQRDMDTHIKKPNFLILLNLFLQSILILDF